MVGIMFVFHMAFFALVMVQQSSAGLLDNTSTGSVEAGGIASSSMTTTKAASSYPTEEQKIELFKSEIDYSETNNSESFNRTKRGTGWDVMELIGKTACRAALLSDKEEKRAVTEAPKKRKTKNSPKKTRYEDE